MKLRNNLVLTLAFLSVSGAAIAKESCLDKRIKCESAAFSKEGMCLSEKPVDPAHKLMCVKQMEKEMGKCSGDYMECLHTEDK